MPLQTGVDLVIAYRKETTFGVLPANDISAKSLRRLKFGIGLKKDAIRSAEIRRDYQRPAPRHAMRMVEGPIEGELSLGTYADLIGSALRRDFAAVALGAALTDVTASASAPHFVRATGSWLTMGLRVGMTFRMSGWATTGTANNAKNFTITALTATQITVLEVVAAKAAGDSVTFTVPGKVTYIPSADHTNDSYAFEQWAPSAGNSRRFLGNRVGGIEIALPPNNKASITISLKGQNRAKDTSQYFTNAVAPTTTQMQTGLSGTLLVNGAAVAIITNVSIKTDAGLETIGVVGADVTRDVFHGSIDVSGSFSALWQDGSFDGYFDDESVISLIVQMRDTVAANTDVMNIVLPNVKVSGGDVADGEKALVQSFEFVAFNGVQPGYESTSLFIQDTQA